MNRGDLPICYSFPDKLIFMAQDNDGNIREITYYRADKYITISGRVEEIFKLDEHQKDWKMEENND